MNSISSHHSCPPRIAWCRRVLPLVALLGVVACAPAQNRTLKLDGRGSYAEVSNQGYEQLTESTVEMWVRWDALRTYSRVFEYGSPWRSVSLFINGSSPDLRFNVYPSDAKTNPAVRYTAYATNAIRTNEWLHLAAIAGPGGMLLYVNGRLVAQHPNTAGFPQVAEGAVCYLGKGLVGNAGDESFEGQIDEVRLWNHRRTVSQIRDSMFKRLSGREPGLVHLWNFDDGTANDAVSPGGVGKLFGNAAVVPSDLGLVVEPVVAPVAAGTAGSANGDKSNAVALWIAVALTALAMVLAWLALMFRRSGLGSAKIVGTQPAQTGLPAPSSVAPLANDALRERALAELTSFAKESLVQGLYTQRAALLEAQKQAQQELVQIEARLSNLDLPDRIQAYEVRIADLVRQLATRGHEVEELTQATLQLLRRKLAEEKSQMSSGSRFN